MSHVHAAIVHSCQLAIYKRKSIRVRVQHVACRAAQQPWHGWQSDSEAAGLIEELQGHSVLLMEMRDNQRKLLKLQI